MCASYIENSLQKKSSHFKKTRLREGIASMTIPKNPYGFFYSSGNVTPVRAILSLTFEDSNAEYGIYPYSA